jgi:alkylation response protein AidB-like acyl-CoA dehydrogenase
MDFSLTETQQDVQKLAQKILADHSANDYLAKVDVEYDHFDPTLWQALATAGLLGLAIDEAFGGMAYGFETLCLLVEEVGRSAAAVPAIPVLVNAALVLQQFGSEEQQARLLPGVADGSHLLSAAMVEPDNENAARPASRASQAPDSSWLVSGVKHCVPLANRARRVLLSARSEQGLVVFLLDPGAEAVLLSRQQVTAGEPQYRLQFDQVAIAARDVVAVGERAETLVSLQLQQSRAAICAMTVGLTDRMMRMTAQYTSQREQFGRPIATFQAVAHRAADCYIDIECLRLVTQQAVALLQQGGDAREAVQVAKIWCGDVAHRLSQSAQHLHGGIGVDRDYPLFRYCLWARQLELSLGGSAMLKAELGVAIAEQYASA